uniref:Uncharacterized protein n=1 Tax=Daphnia galeata TaxID=27404 RepID=A0A8J2WJE2_9CRUS|nr:unnamed protein product [Daphnia galeata]
MTSPRKAVANFAKACQALLTSTFGYIFCRDTELAIIENFMEPHIKNKKLGRMYISGRQGTGKTVCVTQKSAKEALPFREDKLTESGSMMFTEKVCKNLFPGWKFPFSTSIFMNGTSARIQDCSSEHLEMLRKSGCYIPFEYSNVQDCPWTWTGDYAVITAILTTLTLCDDGVDILPLCPLHWIRP